MEGTKEGPRSVYREKRVRHGRLREAARAASLRLSTARVAAFIAVAALLVGVDVLEPGAVETGALALSVVGALGFVFLVVRHRRVRREERWHGILETMAGEGLLRLDRAWESLESSLPEDERAVPDVAGDHPFARDLNVVGPTSLGRLAGPVTSAVGRRTLRGWLLTPAPPETAQRRAAAVRRLAPLLDERMELAAHGRLAVDPPAETVEGFLAWAEDEPWVGEHRWLRMAAWLLPVALAATVAADLSLGWPPLWLLPAVAQGVLLKRFLARLNADFARVGSMRDALGAYVPQLRVLEAWPDDGGSLEAVRHRLGEGDDAAHRRLSVLAGLVDTVDSRRNMVYAALAPAFLLDVHLAARLDAWRRRSGPAVREWLTALGEAEALSALAALAHDHPDWTFPTWRTDEEARVEATGLGHPLLAPGECVRNDVQVGPPGSFLLVTGSNMSGKSTLLRALGANVVLAGAGGPVCAASLTLVPVRVWTSMRIEDNLAEGVSLFMAELLRVRDIVEAAGVPGVPPVFYLLDEILHGTNTAERSVAARAVVRHLVDHGAIGAVSTHDLTLAESPQLTPHAENVHFREQVSRVEGRTHLDFDYRLRPGVATTRNALRLLEAVGLDLEELREE